MVDVVILAPLWHIPLGDFLIELKLIFFDFILEKFLHFKIDPTSGLGKVI